MTLEKAISNGFEDAMKDKGRDCDYEFLIEDQPHVKRLQCEVKIDNGYIIRYEQDKSQRLNMNEVERKSYQFLLERL